MATVDFAFLEVLQAFPWDLLVLGGDIALSFDQGGFHFD